MLKPQTIAGFAFLIFIIFATATTAQEQQLPTQSQSVEKVALTEILDAVRKNSKKTFLINRHIHAEIAVGSISVGDTDYATLLQILRNNGLATFSVDGIVNIVPVGIVRQYLLPMMTDASTMHDEEWVTGILRLENAPAATMVPIMRPMMPQAGHIAANPNSNSVIIVDRLGNAKRIFAMIRQLDRDATAQPQ